MQSLFNKKDYIYYHTCTGLGGRLYKSFKSFYDLGKEPMPPRAIRIELIMGSGWMYVKSFR